MSVCLRSWCCVDTPKGKTLTKAKYESKFGNARTVCFPHHFGLSACFLDIFQLTLSLTRFEIDICFFVPIPAISMMNDFFFGTKLHEEVYEMKYFSSQTWTAKRKTFRRMQSSVRWSCRAKDGRLESGGPYIGSPRRPTAARSIRKRFPLTNRPVDPSRARWTAVRTSWLELNSFETFLQFDQPGPNPN